MDSGKFSPTRSRAEDVLRQPFRLLKLVQMQNCYFWELVYENICNGGLGTIFCGVLKGQKPSRQV